MKLLLKTLCLETYIAIKKSHLHNCNGNSHLHNCNRKIHQHTSNRKYHLKTSKNATGVTYITAIESVSCIVPTETITCRIDYRNFHLQKWCQSDILLVTIKKLSKRVSTNFKANSFSTPCTVVLVLLETWQCIVSINCAIY